MDLFSIYIFAVGPTAQYAADAKYKEKRARKKVMGEKVEDESDKEMGEGEEEEEELSSSTDEITDSD